MMGFPLRGKVVLVTGAGSGIGRGIALELALRGSRVAICARNAGTIHELELEIAQSGGEAFSCALDVTRRDDVREFIRRVVERFGPIDVVVAAAGQYVRGPVSSLGIPAYEQTMAVNFYGVLNVFYEVLPSMLSRRTGHLLAVGSVDGKKGLPLDAAYVASKFALTGFMDVLRQELYGTGIYVTTVLPGRVDTPMIADLRTPAISPKAPVRKVVASVVRALGRSGGEVVVPWLGPITLLTADFLSTRLGDWLVRVFHLEGSTHTPERL